MTSDSTTPETVNEWKSLLLLLAVLGVVMAGGYAGMQRDFWKPLPGGTAASAPATHHK